MYKVKEARRWLPFQVTTCCFIEEAAELLSVELPGADQTQSVV